MEQIYDNWKERLEEILLEERRICVITDPELREKYRDRYIQLVIEEDEIRKKLQKVRKK